MPGPGFAWRDPQLWEQLFRAGDLKGDLPSEINPQLGVNISALDMMAPEFLFLRRWNRVHAGDRIAAVAAQFSGSMLLPSTQADRFLAVVERVIISNPTAGGLSYAVQVALPQIAIAQPTVGTPKALDDRVPPFNVNGPLTKLGIRLNASAARMTDTTAMIVSVPATSTIALELQAVLTNRVGSTTPAFMGVMVECLTVNSTLDVSYIWRERDVLNSELS